MPLLLALLLFSPLTFAKRVMIEPPKMRPSSLPELEQKHLAHRVGKMLHSCTPEGAEVFVEVNDKTAEHLDTGIIAAALQEDLKPALGTAKRKLEVKATLTYREWKTGRYKCTFTLKAEVRENGKKICEGLHRTVKPR